jgi:hypothetical protein
MVSGIFEDDDEDDLIVYFCEELLAGLAIADIEHEHEHKLEHEGTSFRI